MRPMLTRSTQAMACAAALVILAACGGDADGEKTSASSSSTSSEPTYNDDYDYDYDYAYAKAKNIDKKLKAHDSNKPLPEDATWVTDSYRDGYNAEVAEFKKANAVKKGKVTVNSDPSPQVRS